MTLSNGAPSPSRSALTASTALKVSGIPNVVPEVIQRSVGASVFKPPSRITVETHVRAGIFLKGTELEKCYDGPLVNGLRHGHGTYEYPNRFFKYSGEYVNGKKHGKGTLSMADGSTYEGDFDEEEITGKGKRTWPDGSTYVGDFLNGERTGKGAHTDAEGNVFEGVFFENSREGHGRMTYSNGDVLEVNWESNQPNGLGVYETPQGDKYEGDWIEGERTGVGRYDGANGDYYEGEWVADEYYGMGIRHISASGMTHECMFVEGEVKYLPLALQMDKISVIKDGKDGNEETEIPQPLQIMAG
eukprot:CAMPEP_0198223858 /NCGR_PEP_ID=MMETSP1445-20131203/94385_1 /TAXON_ID=36898 /ORGANISM="Pyramimonas sp., Strain CCMP2087" /LENGTH=301 /DNA_ID=CAMNT_0043902837 /DNA_START=213 /DNA_END=1115 /DNA_ORIENTATION=-